MGRHRSPLDCRPGGLEDRQLTGQRPRDRRRGTPHTGVPRCTHELREGRLSLDQVAVIAERAADGSDDHYAELASVATVSQLRTAIKLEPRPDPGPTPDPTPAISKTSDTEYDTWRIRLPHPESAMLDAALQSHRDALITTWKHDLDAGADSTGQHPRCPPPSTPSCG